MKTRQLLVIAHVTITKSSTVSSAVFPFSSNIYIGRLSSIQQETINNENSIYCQEECVSENDIGEMCQ